MNLAARIFAVLLFAIAFLLSGCHASPPKVEAAVTDACKVLTPAEISAVLGVPIDEGVHIPASSQIMCAWSQNGMTGEAGTKLILHFNTMAAFQKEKAATGNVVITPLSGIGDEAFYATTEFGTALYIRKGDMPSASRCATNPSPKTRLWHRKRLSA